MLIRIVNPITDFETIYLELKQVYPYFQVI